MSYEARYFTKRSVTISAMPTDGTPESNRAVIDWTRGSATPAFMDKNVGDKEQLSINTLEGAHWVTPGDWIVRGIKGEHYPVKPDIFDALYDQVPQAPPAADDGGASEAVVQAAGDQGSAESSSQEGSEGTAAWAPIADVGAELPRYRCHKVVRALKLSDITRNNDTRQVTVVPEDKSYQPFDATPGWYGRFHGSDDDTGYFVQYEDGFLSWSPTKAFEDGYSLIAVAQSDVDQRCDYCKSHMFQAPNLCEDCREKGLNEIRPDAAPAADLDDDLTFKSPHGIAELARVVGASARYFSSDAWDGSDFFTSEEAAIMADFVRDNPDAPVEAMFIHLSLKKRYPRTEPNRADLFVLSLFHAACKAAIAFEADQAAEQAAAKTKPAPSGGWPGDRALQPSKPAMSPSGFSPR